MTLSSRRMTFFSRTTSGQIKTWSCWIEADGITVTSSWGIKGGKMQMTSDTATSRGRKGTQAFKSPQEVAQEDHARQVKQKMRAGYVEAEERAAAVRLEEMKTDLDFDRLPRSFAPAKPIRESDAVVVLGPDGYALTVEGQRLQKGGFLAIQRKRDGMRHYIVSGTGKDGQIRVFSRGMDDMTAHFERLIQELTLPPGTVLDAEFVVTTPGGDDDFTAVSEICRSKADRARRTMASYERNGSDLRLMVFDLLFYDRLPTWQLPYRERRAALLLALDKAHVGKKSRTQFHHVIPMQQYERPLMDCIRLTLRKGWEGLVLWRNDQSTQVRMNRSPARCNCSKFKPMREEDFIATGFELGSGKNSKVVGALNLALTLTSGKGRVSLGNVGTGFDDATRKAALKWKYPCVVQIKYEKMSETGLRFPSFLRLRPDKKPKECTADL